MIKALFTFTLLTGTLITLSSTNWISAWIGLELNLLSFIPLIMNKNDQQTSEAALKYFLVQTFASIFLLFSMFMFMMINYSNIPMMLNSMIAASALALKMAAAPLHFWFPAIMQGLSWLNCLILMTWQKLAPLFMMSAMNSQMMMMFAMTSSVVGAVGGYNQMLLRKILAYSSINHMGWLIIATMMSETMVMQYFMIYSLLNTLIIYMTSKWNILHLSQTISQNSHENINLLLVTNLLSLGGIPPFIGFLPKWIIISTMVNKMPIQITILTLSSLISLYFYLRITYNMMLKSPSHSPFIMNKSSKMVSTMTLFSAGAMLIVAPMM